ncbi:hypothetical protein CYLTODRAFT_457308 [Cylindrobasidium torrendii FP15055 ss-10]|uniref:PH domain-containing protein n=1 Tax=Cylindrobasidium torrendii FP15055 ss-10 TaxID=1314674 RepID=A0A0D7B473_9AGAR|nr:hypothetical protein CYLTODRAFT_457308 [Cylindrobasidium torrendii FP15055 ss-10]
MNTHRSSPLQDRLLSNSPDPVKSNILRESGMGWNSPPSSSDNRLRSKSPTSPLRLVPKKKKPMPDIHRRSSSSYQYARNHNLVSKSPFKSSAPPSSQSSSPFPSSSSSSSSAMSPRRVSGEKRPRPPSMYEEAEAENERPLALKRDRKQSKTYQAIMQKEPVTKSPFRRTSDEDIEVDGPPPLPPKDHFPAPSSPTVARPVTPSRSPSPSKAAPNTPSRSALVSRRMHGPRITGGKRERRKTVTWDETCDVVEISCDESGSENAVDDGDDWDYDNGEPQDMSFQGNQHDYEHEHEEGPPRADESYESVELSDAGQGQSMDAVEHHTANTSVNGFTDEMFGAQTSTPPRNVNDLPTDLETEDGIPFGRSHHAERAHRRQVSVSPAAIPFEPRSPEHTGVYSTPPADDDVDMLPESPSPSKKRSLPQLSGSPMPQLNMSAGSASVVSLGEDLYERSAIQDELLPHDKSIESSFADTELDISGLEEELMVHGAEQPLVDTSALSFVSSTGSAHNSPRPLPSVHAATPPSPSMSNILGSPVALPDRVQPRPSGDDLRRLAHQRSQSHILESPSASFASHHSLSSSFGARPTMHSPSSSFSGNLPAATHSPSPSVRPLMPSPQSSFSKAQGASNSSPSSHFARKPAPEHVDSPMPSPTPAAFPSHTTSEPMLDKPDLSIRPKEVDEKDRDRMSVLTTMTDVSIISAENATIHTAEKRNLHTAVGVLESHQEEGEEEFGKLKVDGSNSLKFDFGSKFGRGLGFGGLDIDTSGDFSTPPLAPLPPRRKTPPKVTEDVLMTEAKSMPSHDMVSLDTGSVDVKMDARSALDRLIGDVSVNGFDPNDASMSTDADESLVMSDAEPEESVVPRLMVRAATDSAIVINAPPAGMVSRSASGASTISGMAPPQPPPKDAIRSRDEAIIQMRREKKRAEAEAEAEFLGKSLAPRAGRAALGNGRPMRRRSRSTGDVRVASGGLLGDAPLPVEEDQLADSIEKELQKLGGIAKSTQKYHVREHEVIVASSDNVPHMNGAGDLNTGKAWKTVRRPSDMNEYAKQFRDSKARGDPAHGKVFVKALGIRRLTAPLPQEPTAFTCTLNNGVHFVTTPECRLERECPVNQEFELIEHSKLEFTLTIKIRRDPHIVSMFKSLVPPPAPMPVRPPPVQQTASRSGLRSFFSSSPKKSSREKMTPPPIAQPLQAPMHRMPENLARYLKPDGTYARAFISFKDIAARCDTKLFETAIPLIGQKVQPGGKVETQVVGEILLQVFRLPPLPGILQKQLPQSLEECQRGLRHINWHKVTYFEGVLTQNGGDCNTWKRRQLRVIGSNLVAYRGGSSKPIVTATISLKKAIAVEDPQARSLAMSPASRNRYYDEYDGVNVEHSFRLVFPEGESISFYADTEEEKARWLQVLNALVGHIPPHPVWAELLWQRQEEAAKARAAGGTGGSGLPARS